MKHTFDFTPIRLSSMLLRTMTNRHADLINSPPSTCQQVNWILTLSYSTYPFPHLPTSFCYPSSTVLAEITLSNATDAWESFKSQTKHSIYSTCDLRLTIISLQSKVVLLFWHMQYHPQAHHKLSIIFQSALQRPNGFLTSLHRQLHSTTTSQNRIYNYLELPQLSTTIFCSTIFYILHSTILLSCWVNPQ